jgi:RHS repeat-associated protein
MTSSTICTTTAHFSRSRFTGKERDAESGNDYFEARYYSSTMGRFMSPDWAAKEEPVPYATFDDPQSLNLYSYVRNNPLSRADKDGHCDWCQKIWNAVVHGEPVTNKELPAAEAATKAAVAAYKQWNKDHPGQVPPGTKVEVGIIFSPIGAIGAAGGALAEGSALTVPAYASGAGGFVNWLKNLSSSGTKLTAEEADAIIAKGEQLGVKVRLDPPHPGTNWEVPHLNVGEEGQVHLEVPQNYSNPNVSLGSATKP